ncbi:MAG: exopolysaccharide Pel transporter PelG [Pseudomonadales bacterium]
MAGIGFELRRILNRDSYAATLQAYVYAGLISAGPWVLSIFSVLLVGVMSISVVVPTQHVVQFLVSITYLMAASLTITGGCQLLFTRFVSDRLYEKRPEALTPNLFGLLVLMTSVFGVLGTIVFFRFFPDQSLAYRALMLGNFLVLINLWVVVIFLSGMKAYNRILTIMFFGYATMVAAAWVLRHANKEGLLLAFLLGHAVLLYTFLVEVIRQFPVQRWFAFEFLDRRQIFPSLAFTGLFYYLGIWVDKFLFWFNPATSEAVIGPLRASEIYDIPIFLAYLTIIPGMAVFLVRIETDFAENYDRFYNAIRGGEALDHVYFLKDQMTASIRQGVLEIFKVQGVTILLFFLWAEEILELLSISTNYLPLLYVDVVGVSVQMVLMSLLNVLFYLDRRGTVLIVTATFFAANVVLTLLTQSMGVIYFGYGFVGATMIATFLTIVLLNRIVRELEYETFMLNR